MFDSVCVISSQLPCARIMGCTCSWYISPWLEDRCPRLGLRWLDHTPGLCTCLDDPVFTTGGRSLLLRRLFLVVPNQVSPLGSSSGQCRTLSRETNMECSWGLSTRRTLALVWVSSFSNLELGYFGMSIILLFLFSLSLFDVLSGQLPCFSKVGD